MAIFELQVSTTRDSPLLREDKPSIKPSRPAYSPMLCCSPWRHTCLSLCLSRSVLLLGILFHGLLLLLRSPFAVLLLPRWAVAESPQPSLCSGRHRRHAVVCCRWFSFFSSSFFFRLFFFFSFPFVSYFLFLTLLVCFVCLSGSHCFAF